MPAKACARTLTMLLMSVMLLLNSTFVHAVGESGQADTTKLKTGFRYGVYNLTPGKKKQMRKGYDGSGFNIKAMPALFWNSASVEMELPVHKSFSVAVSGTFKLGRTDGKQSNFRVNPAEYLDNGFRLDLHVRYFPVSHAPFGFYADAFASYGQIVYFDGTTRPYSLLNRVKEKNDLRSPSNISKPQPFGAGVGVGYQVLLIPKKVVANFFFGVQSNIDGDNTIFLSGFVAPSLGILF